MSQEDVPQQPASEEQGPLVYDFKHPERVTKDQLRTLRGLHEKFAQTFGTSLSTVLRTIVHVELESLEQMAYSDYMASLPNPHCMYILEFNSLEGNALLAVDPELTMFIIDRLLGGGGEKYAANRSITTIEQSVLQQVVERGLRQLNDIWQQVFTLQSKIVNFESNPLFVQISPATEIVILLRFKVHGGEMSSVVDLCFPYFVLEDVLPKLAQRWHFSTAGENEGYSSPLINRQLNKVDIPVVVMIDSIESKISDLLQLQVGDVLRLNRRVNDDLDIMIDDRTKYRGRVGTVGSRVAVQVTSMVHPEEENNGG